jgi:hypothetical protein
MILAVGAFIRVVAAEVKVCFERVAVWPLAGALSKLIESEVP